MVSIPVPDAGTFCIDSTEVTNGHYAAFLDANVPIEGQPTVCSWNATYAPPPGWWPAPDAEKPIVAIDWCDAVAFCAWSGKRLCGAIGGGPLSTTSLTTPMLSEWMYACTAGGTRTYSYGNTFSKTACVTDQPILLGTGPAPVGTAPGCVGGFPGLHDMSGNVDELQDYADGQAGEDDGVASLGGAYYSQGPTESQCASVFYEVRSAEFGSTGFRCCKDGT